MNPADYIRLRREAAGLSLDDAAIALETVPAVSAASRAEWLRQIEAGVAPLQIDVAVALGWLIRFDWDVLVELSAQAQGLQPCNRAICRHCGCSEYDPCVEPGGGTCAWLTKDVCTRCEAREAGVPGKAAA